MKLFISGSHRLAAHLPDDADCHRDRAQAPLCRAAPMAIGQLAIIELLHRSLCLVVEGFNVAVILRLGFGRFTWASNFSLKQVILSLRSHQVDDPIAGKSSKDFTCEAPPLVWYAHSQNGHQRHFCVQKPISSGNDGSSGSNNDNSGWLKHRYKR